MLRHIGKGGNVNLVLSRPQSFVASSRQSFVTFGVRRPVPKEGGLGLQARTVSSAKGSSQNWRRLALFVKATRVPILLTALYTLGYQNGVVETVRNPLKIQQGTFEEICASFGVTHGNQVSIVGDKAKDPRLSRIGWMRGYEERDIDKQTEKVAAIGREIIQAARQYVRKQLGEATRLAREELKVEEDELSKVDFIRKLNENEDVKTWTQALERIEGFSVDGIENWQYVVIDTSVPNAFVSEMLPQRFFVTTGLFAEFVNNDDELAMILGHEISHLIMGHNSKSNVIEFLFRGLEITLLMLDPTEGMFSLMVASFLASSRDAMVAAHSRSNETEADELGCQLAAMACFDTLRGSKVFLKMNQFEEAQGGAKNNLMSSHPASEGRYEFVKQLSEDENLSKYSYCNTLGKQLKRAYAIATRPKDD
jgi:Zn-dependent protease with chaperone function